MGGRQMQIKDITDSLPRHPTKRYHQRTLDAITHIVVHHSATASGTPEAFARHHVNMVGWPGIGYHYVIGGDGQIYKCQPATIVSYHSGMGNQKSIGICLVGNMDVQRPTPEQQAALRWLLQELMGAYSIPTRRVIGHREVSGARTNCPGKNLDLNGLRKTLRA